MKWHLFLALGGPAQAIAGLQPFGEPQLNDGVVCYTYLSTYLVAIAAETAAPEFPTVPTFPTTRGIVPPFFSNRSTSVPPSAVTEASEIENPATFIDFTTSDFAIPTEDEEDSGATATDSGSLFLPTLVTSTANEASPTSSEPVSGQAVIFFVSPQVDNEKRDIVKRAPGGFIGDGNANVDICTNAGTFRLGDGQLVDLQDPIYYNGESYKEFRSEGTPPEDAITREFSNVGGTLVFSNRALPNTNAGFCQDKSGQVYITFTSSPPGCVPISLRVYAVEQCQNGQIIGLDPAKTATTEPNQFSTIAETINTAFTETATFPGRAETTPSSDPTQSFTSSPADQTTTVTSDLSSEDSSSIPSLSFSSSSTETPLSFTTSIETPAISESFTSLLSFFTTASSDFFSSDSTPSSDFFSSTDTIASEPTSTLAIESSTESAITPEESSTITDESTATTEEATTTVTKELTTTTEVLTTTTEEATTTTTEEPTTTTGCNSVEPLSTVALANPTPVFSGDAFRNDEFASIVVPWDGGLAGTDQSRVYINTNGYITVDAGNTNPENREVPTDTLVNRAFLPYWDDLVLDPTKGHTIVYEFSDTSNGRQLTIEFLLGKAGSSGIYHFDAIFLEDTSDWVIFRYYTTPESGSSATAGFQNLLTGITAQVSLNQGDVLFDGRVIYLLLTQTDYYALASFDNTECGKGQLIGV